MALTGNARFDAKVDEMLRLGRTTFNYYDFYTRSPDYEEEMTFADELLISLDTRGYDCVKTNEVWPPEYVFEKRMELVTQDFSSSEDEDKAEDDEGWIEVAPKRNRRVYIPIKRSLARIRGHGKYMENRFLCKTPCSFCDRCPRILFSCSQEGCQWLTCIVCLGTRPERKVCGGCGFGMDRSDDY